jgi:hypothetical protein
MQIACKTVFNTIKSTPLSPLFCLLIFDKSQRLLLPPPSPVVASYQVLSSPPSRLSFRPPFRLSFRPFRRSSRRLFSLPGVAAAARAAKEVGYSEYI